jgi:predicted O-linked N-acetylglucosamine transferase (SPINDLY family)
MAILRQVPQGVLWLLRQSDTAVKNLKNGAAKAGINPERLIFGNALQIKHHLARLLLADLALDPFIYNGGATTSNALWAGVPVICLMGTDFVSRMSASALMAVGLGSLVTQSPDEYVRLAVDLGLHPEKRKLIKQHLQQGRRHFPLFNTNLFARHLESAFQIMWDRYISGRKPETFTVRIEEKDQDSQAI